MISRLPALHHAVARLAVLLPALFPAICGAQSTQPAQPAGPRIDGPQLRLPAASEQVVNVLASVRLHGGAPSAMVPLPLPLARQFVRGVQHPFDLMRPTSERYSAFEDFRDARWQTFRAGDLLLDWQRLLGGVQPQGCEQGTQLTVYYQVRYQAKPTFAGVPGKLPPPDLPPPGIPDRNPPTPEGMPAGNPPPAGFRLLPAQAAVSNVVSDSVCVLLQQ
jgi:hypothetical protein